MVHNGLLRDLKLYHFNAPPGEVFYMIKIEHPDGCNPAACDGEYTSVYSNVATNSLVSVSESKDPDFSIYPIPAGDRINVRKMRFTP